MLSNIKNGRLDKTVKIGIWAANGCGIYNLLDQSAKVPDFGTHKWCDDSRGADGSKLDIQSVILPSSVEKHDNSMTTVFLLS